MSQTPYLTKSSYVRGIACVRMLWLGWHRRQPYEDPAPGSPAAVGIDIGTRAHNLFPGGILVDEQPWEHDAAVARTRDLMADPTVPAVFEAAFEHDGVRIRADVMERLGNDRWGLREVKSAARVKARYVDDATIQAHVIRASGIKLGSIELVHVNTSYVFAGGAIDWQQYFARSNIAEQVAAALPDVATTISAQQATLAQAEEPILEPGPHCPSGCDYWEHCTAAKPRDWIFTLPRLSEARFAALTAAGVERIENIPDDFPLTDPQDRMRDVIVSSRAYVSDNLAADLAPLAGPAAYLDFEAMNPAVPLYAGTRPYQRIPFQWSLHRDDRAGRLGHTDFLADPTRDPREAFTDSLIDTFAGDAEEPILVYSPYEKSVLREMAELFPDRGTQIERIIARLVDLYVIVRNNVYLEGFAGSFSIKTVSKTLAPDFSYAGLEHVADGAQAATAFERLARGGVNGNNAAELRDALRAYCRLDTLAMVKTHRGLGELAVRQPA